MRCPAQKGRCCAQKGPLLNNHDDTSFLERFLGECSVPKKLPNFLSSSIGKPVVFYWFICRRCDFFRSLSHSSLTLNLFVRYRSIPLLFKSFNPEKTFFNIDQPLFECGFAGFEWRKSSFFCTSNPAPLGCCRFWIVANEERFASIRTLFAGILTYRRHRHHCFTFLGGKILFLLVQFLDQYSLFCR